MFDSFVENILNEAKKHQSRLIPNTYGLSRGDYALVEEEVELDTFEEDEDVIWKKGLILKILKVARSGGKFGAGIVRFRYKNHEEKGADDIVSLAAFNRLIKLKKLKLVSKEQLKKDVENEI